MALAGMLAVGVPIFTGFAVGTHRRRRGDGRRQPDADARRSWSRSTSACSGADVVALGRRVSCGARPATRPPMTATSGSGAAGRPRSCAVRGRCDHRRHAHPADARRAGAGHEDRLERRDRAAAVAALAGRRRQAGGRRGAGRRGPDQRRRSTARRAACRHPRRDRRLRRRRVAADPQVSGVNPTSRTAADGTRRRWSPSIRSPTRTPGRPGPGRPDRRHLRARRPSGRLPEHIYVGGAASANRDFTAAVSGRLPLVIGSGDVPDVHRADGAVPVARAARRRRSS